MNFYLECILMKTISCRSLSSYFLAIVEALSHYKQHRITVCLFSVYAFSIGIYRIYPRIGRTFFPEKWDRN